MPCMQKRPKRLKRPKSNEFKMAYINSINSDEQKLCFLKYLLTPNYLFTTENITILKQLNNKTPHYFKEDLDGNQNKGRMLIDAYDYINGHLPTYIIFKKQKPNYKNTNKWRRIQNKISRNDLTSRNSIRIFHDFQDFKEYNSNYIYDTEFQRDNITISIYGDTIEPNNIYKKIRVKYDIYYVNLKDYDTIITKINFLKNKQLLELLGAELIIIDRQNLSKDVNSHIVGITNYSVTESLEIKNETANTEKNLDIYKYKLRKGFYSNVDAFLEKVDKDKYIILSRVEIEADFELKALIGARIEKSLKEFNKLIYVSKISNKEHKLELLINKSYGLSFGRTRNSNTMDFIKIKAIFYGVELLYCIDEIPLTYDGFRILNDIKNEEKRKYIENFYIRVLKKNNYMTRHIERMETINNQDGNDVPEETHYHKLTQNINSYFNIEQLLESLTNPDDVSLNEKGFNTLRMRSMQHSRETYIRYKEKFINRVLKINTISIERFKDFIITKKKLPWVQFIESKIKTFAKIKQYVIEFLGNVEYCAINDIGYYFVFSNANCNKRKTILHYAMRFMQYHHNFTDEQIEVVLDYINNMSDAIIEIIFMLDYYSFKHLLSFIERDEECCPVSWGESLTPIRQSNTTPLCITNSPRLTNNDIMCMVGL
jgi:hypothetical protein